MNIVHTCAIGVIYLAQVHSTPDRPMVRQTSNWSGRRKGRQGIEANVVMTFSGFVQFNDRRFPARCTTIYINWMCRAACSLNQENFPSNPRRMVKWERCYSTMSRAWDGTQILTIHHLSPHVSHNGKTTILQRWFIFPCFLCITAQSSPCV